MPREQLGLGLPLKQPKLTELYTKSPEKYSFNTGSHADLNNWTPGFAYAKAQADAYWQKVRKMKMKPIPVDLPSTIATTTTMKKNSIADCNLRLIPSPVAVRPKTSTPFDDNNNNKNGKAKNHSDLTAYPITQSQDDGNTSPPHPRPPACLKDDKVYEDPVNKAKDEGAGDDGTPLAPWTLIP